MAMRILVLRGGALGDFLVTLPALGLLRGRWPEARIDLVGNATAGRLGVEDGVIDAVHSQHESRWRALFDHALLPAGLAAWLGEFDLVVNFWPDPDGELAAHFPLRPGQRFLTAPANPSLAPAARHFCESLRQLGLGTSDFRARLRILRPGPSGDRSTSPVAIHPGSGSVRKTWPPERWVDVLSRLEDPVLLVLGDAEEHFLDVARGLQSGAAGRRWQVAQGLPLPELARRLAACRLFLGHDSGVSHLAAAVGTPCLLLFGPTDPAMWAPPGDHITVIRRGGSLDAIFPEEVLAAARAVGRTDRRADTTTRNNR